MNEPTPEMWNKVHAAVKHFLKHGGYPHQVREIIEEAEYELYKEAVAMQHGPKLP